MIGKEIDPLFGIKNLMYSPLSTQCLDTMGIQIWRSRALLPGSAHTLDFIAYTLHDPTGALVGSLCLESRCISIAQEAAFSRLLDAMLSAIGLKKSLLQTRQVPQTARFHIVMGEALAQAALASEVPLDTLRAGNLYSQDNGSQLLVTYHPLDLLLETGNKAKAWEDLKRLKDT